MDQVGRTLVIVAILVSTFGCVNGLILGGGRVPYAMAREGLLFRGCTAVDAAQDAADGAGLPGVWSMVLALSGSVPDVDHLLQFRLGHVCRADGGGRLLAPHPAARPTAPFAVLGLSADARRDL